MHLDVIWPYWSWLSQRSNLEETGTCFRKKTKSSIATSFWQQLSCHCEITNIVFYRFPLICFIFNLFFCYASEGQISNQPKFCQWGLNVLSWLLSLGWHILLMWKIKMNYGFTYLVSLPLLSQTDQMKISSLSLLWKTFLHAITMHCYVSVYMVNKSSWVNILFKTILYFNI